MITLLTYDICEPRRLKRMHTFMKDYGVNTQKSVFECDIDSVELREITDYCIKNLNLKEDSVRIYKICSGCMKKVLISGLGEKVLNVDYQIY
ncbi:MAG: CRISPR-associated endonuclease Cas2 [Candidatus Dadabacteria bacterium]|nr:MAG: CRISPR-associated endonuclease Cas2 [Candidatus Dadabacteria bacterium]